MRVLVMSDTHGSVEYFKKLKRFMKDVDFSIHLGDVLYHGPRNPLPDGYDPAGLARELENLDIEYVRGNCDADVDLLVLELRDMPKTRYFHILPFNMVALHGENLEDPIDFASDVGANVVLFGHTHIPRLEVVGDVLVLNPGSVSLPKGGNPPSFAILNFENRVLEAEVLDLEGEVLMEGRFRL